jgi:hypothetical protein
MAITLGSSGITFADGTTQTVSGSSVGADTGSLLAISSYTDSGTYTWAAQFPTTLTSAATSWSSAGASVAATGSNPYTLACSSGAANWSQSLYSTSTGTYIQGQPAQTTAYQMIGLTTTPGASYTSIEYALYFAQSGALQIYESGAYVGAFGTYDTSFIGRVTYDGATIRYYADPLGMRCIRTVAVAGKTLKGIATFYNTGSFVNVYFGTLTTNTQAKTALVKVVGAGGGSAGYMESGAAGGYSEKYIDVSAVTTVTVTVGGGGAGVTYYAAAGQGGTSSFGSYATATGGYGSNQNYSHTGGHGGVGSGGAVNLYGGGGTGHGNYHSNAAGSKGGASYFGSSHHVRYYYGTQSGASGAPGAGAAGGNTDGTNGTPFGYAGRPGAVIVYAYK